MADQYPLHPETRALYEMSKGKPFDPKAATVEGFRVEAVQGNDWLNSSYKCEFDGTKTELHIPSSHVPDGIPVDVYKPTNLGKNPPVLIVYHGGGLVIGDRSFTELQCRILAHQVQMIVVNVEYRLYPENDFEAPYEDACTVANWVVKNKLVIGAGKDSKVGVEGDSAGGKLAASVAHDVQGLSFQVLVYPHTSTADKKFDSYEKYSEAPYMSTAVLEWFHEHMRGVEKRCGYHPRGDSLGRGADSIKKLPPALLIVAEIDPLADMGLQYGKRLTEHHVTNEIVVIKGACHGFYTMPGHFKECCKEAYAATEKWIRKYGTAQ